MRGGLLTQGRLGELIGDVLGDAGYSRTAVSDWELGKSHISAVDRRVLLALLAVLHECEGLLTSAEADELLAAGNFRALDDSEEQAIFGPRDFEQPPLPKTTLTATSPPSVAGTAPAAAQYDRRQRVLLSKVRRFWVEGVLEHSLADRQELEIAMLWQQELVDHPWDDVLAGPIVTSPDEPTGNGILSWFEEADHALLILGEPGAGKTITLLTLTRELVELAERDAGAPVPVVLDLGSWSRSRPPWRNGSSRS